MYWRVWLYLGSNAPNDTVTSVSSTGITIPQVASERMARLLDGRINGPVNGAPTVISTVDRPMAPTSAGLPCHFQGISKAFRKVLRPEYFWVQVKMRREASVIVPWEYRKLAGERREHKPDPLGL
jgi:hypothetical protein